MLTGNEVKKICMQWLIKTDGKVQIDTAHLLALRMSPALARKGRTSVWSATQGWLCCSLNYTWGAKYNLCKVRKIFVAQKIPHLVTHDACIIHYPDSLSKWMTPLRLISNLARWLISTSLTLVTCIWWPESLPWEELNNLLLRSPTERDNLVLLVWLMWETPTAASLPPHSPTFLLLQRQQTMDFFSLRKKYLSNHCWTQRQEIGS